MMVNDSLKMRLFDVEVRVKELELEVDFLRYFYGAAGDVFGPAEDDVYEGIKEEYKESGGVVPPTYEED